MTKNKALMWMALTGAVAAWRIYDMATAREAPSTALWALDWIILVALVVAFFGNAYTYFKAEA